MRNYILLFVNGEQHRVTGSDAFLTLSDFIRLRLKLCGTKIVCSEGDCGSCSVLCGKLTDGNDAVEYLAIDSCIRFVFQLDGCHIVTVEGLAGAGLNGNSSFSSNCKEQAVLNGVQQAMIDCHGSQCGFCTPGFVVAMTGVLEQNDSPTVDDWRHGLTGNLCRCTGYSPIIAAGGKSNRQNTPRINSIYSCEPMCSAVEPVQNDPIQIETGEGSGRKLVCSPTVVSQATDFLAQHPESEIVAGATDVGVRYNKGHCDANIWLDLNRVADLEGVELVTDAGSESIVAGARATWHQLEQLTRESAPQFHEIISIFGSPQIRHVGTIGGNIINASPIADSIPFLFICDAEMELQSQSGTRTVSINDFYTGYKQFDLQPGELLTRVRIPLPAGDTQLRLYKVSRRRDLDISTFTAAIAITTNETNAGQIESASIAYGAVGPVVLRLPKTEQFLVGKPFSVDTMQAAGDVAVDEITPITDVRGGQEFRLHLARNVLVKFYHEVTSQGVSV